MTHMTEDEKKVVYDSVSETLQINTPDPATATTDPDSGDGATECLLASLLTSFHSPGPSSDASSTHVDEMRKYISLPSSAMGADPVLW